MNQITTKALKAAATTLLLISIPLVVFADEIDSVVKSINSKKDEVNDLISTILDVSPTARAKASKYTAKSRSKPSRRTSRGATVPNLGIPESQLLEASAKFPKDFVGKYVYGRVSFKGITQEGNDACIGFTAKGYRMFNFYTKDPKIIQAFSQFTWGTKFYIPKDCPLKILTKDLAFYVVRMPWDQDKTEHSFRELFSDFGKEMQGIMEETKQRINNDLQGIPNY